MIKYLYNASFANGASFKVFHSIFSGQINSFHFCYWIWHLRGLFVCKSLICFLTLWLKNINFVSDKYFNRDLASSFTFCDPLLDSLKCWPLGDVKEVDDGSWPIHVFMHIFMVTLFSWHIEIYDFILISIIDVKSSLYNRK